MEIKQDNGTRVCVLGLPIIAIIVSAALLWLSGCQAGGTSGRAVSLEEAKQITAEFKGTSFVPPPRNINDIMRTINGRKDKTFTAPTSGGFWKPSADVRVAIARGDRKARQSGEAS